MVFIDLSKAFDTVDRSTLWILLRRYGCPETFVKIIQEFHDCMAGAVSIGGSTIDPFEISHGGAKTYPCFSKAVSWHFLVHSFFLQQYCLQCPNTLVHEFSSALDLMENYFNWLD